MMNMGACCEEIKMLRFNPFVHFACKQLTKKRTNVRCNDKRRRLYAGYLTCQVSGV